MRLRGTRSEAGGARAHAGALAAAVACAALPGALAAQTPASDSARSREAPRRTAADTVRRAPVRPDSARPDSARRDSVRRDTTGRDSTHRDTTARARRDSAGRDTSLFTFAEEDSVIAALRARKNYDVTRYQGDTVHFRARDRVLTLQGKPSAVQRGAALLVGPRVRYDDSTQIVTAAAAGARGDSVVLRDPGQGSDVVVRDSVRYNLVERRGVVAGFSTSATQGETWYLRGGTGAIAAADSLTTPNVPKDAEGQRVFYAHNTSVTSCNEETPHYHFVARDVKSVTKRLLVIRPATLYIGEVPVLWLPFVYQDTRPGRRSGLLRPVFGPAELLRNSPTYQRSVRHFGYYTNLGDYADAQGWIDYRSGARPGNQYGFGEFTTTGQLRYKSIDRQLDGSVAIRRQTLTNGLQSLDVTIGHSQDFTPDRRLRVDATYIQNTTVQRVNQFDPNAVLGTTRSNLSFQDRYGPVTASVSGNAVQYAGRPDRQLGFPNLNLNSQTISVTPWLDWTPTFSLTTDQAFRIRQGVGQNYSVTAGGRVDSAYVNASTRTTNLTLGTPIKIFGFQIGLPVAFAEQVQDVPTRAQVYRDVNDSTSHEFRTFNQTYRSTFDVNPSITLPSLFQGTFNVSPNVNLVNVDAGGLFFRTQYTGGRYVTGAKRLTYGLSAAPTLYAFAPGFGPFERFRNAISPTLSYSYSPRATVSDAYLRAQGITRQGYLGALVQNRVSLGFNTNLEAKLRARPDAPPTPAAGVDAGAPSAGQTAGASPTGPLPSDSAGRAGLAAGPPVPNAPIIPTSGGSANAEQRKIKLVSLNFSPLTYDFARADTGKRGFVDPAFNYTATSDVLPGFTLSSQYSLYLGDPTSDTARFKPYRTNTTVSFQLDRNSAVFGALSRLFGLRRGGNSAPVPSPTQGSPTPVGGGDPFFARQANASRVGGSAAYDTRSEVPQDFTLSLNYTESRQRPDIRGATIALNPAAQCTGFSDAQVFARQQCIDQANAGILAGNTVLLNSLTRGTPIYITPPQRSLNINSAFHITQKWGATWQTTYDVERKQFASNYVTLQRELHDWRANFNFTQSPNGNFAFSFAIALKAEPELKFDYNRTSVRSNQ